MSVFIDTSAFLAVLNREDQFHQVAKKVWEEINQIEEDLLCSNYVLIETIALLQRRFGIDAVRVFERDIQPIIDIVWITQEIHHAGMVIVITTNHRKLSLVDCTSFEIVRDLHIKQVFTFDTHFIDQGFNVIPKV